MDPATASWPRTTPPPAPVAGAWVRVRCGAFEWLADQALMNELLNDEGELLLAEWQADGLAEPIKTGPHRRVYRLKLPVGTIYLKHYRTADWQAFLQNVVRPCRAWLEWRAAERVAALGLKTIEPVAVGRRLSNGLTGDNYFISREIPDAEPLDEFVLREFSSLSASRQQAARREIARQLGQLTATLHRGGVIHRDLHPGNVLIQQSDNALKLSLIDLHALHQQRRVSPRQAAGNVALLNNFFARCSTPADRARFLAAYAEVWNHGASPAQRFTRQAARHVERVCRRALQAADRRGDVKWWRGNRRLMIIETSSARCRALSGLGPELLETLRQHPEQAFDQCRSASEPNSVLSLRAVMELTLDNQPLRGIVGTFSASPFRRWNRLLSRPSQVQKAWEMGHALVRRRLPAPRPLLYVESSRKPCDYLVTEEIPGAVSLKRFLLEKRQEVPNGLTEQRLNELIDPLAFQLRKLHDHGFDQTRLTLSSVLVRAEDSPRFWFVGLETMRQCRRVTARRRTRALACLMNSVHLLPTPIPLSQSQRARFLRGYLGRRFSSDWKTLWRNVSRQLAPPRQEAS